MPAREDTAAFAAASTVAALPAIGDTATPTNSTVPAAQPAAPLVPFPWQDAACLPYDPPDCSGVKEALRNHALELQEALVARLAGVRDELL